MRRSSELCLVVAMVLCILGTATCLTVLKPGVHLHGERLLKGTTRFYLIEDLEPSAYYEVRVSYPAINPTDFHMSLLTRDSWGTTRKLLNTEKLLFSTSHTGDIVSSSDNLQFQAADIPVVQGILLNLTAINAGVSTHPQDPNPEATFNLVLEKMMLPNVPYETLRIAAFLLVVGVIAWFCRGVLLDLLAS